MRDDIKNYSDLELVEYMQSILISRATGGEFDGVNYKYIRNKLIKNQIYEKYLPRWIKIYRDGDSFWNFIKGKFDNYKERRIFINSELANLIYFIETKQTSPINDNITFDNTYINEQWQKAIDRKEQDPAGAITAARSLIESVLKYILDEQKIKYKKNVELSELYKKVAESLNMAPEQHQEPIFKQILGGASGVVNGLSPFRNKLGDAHGEPEFKIKPKERHSELAVNLAGSMAIFLYKTFKESPKTHKKI